MPIIFHQQSSNGKLGRLQKAKIVGSQEGFHTDKNAL